MMYLLDCRDCAFSAMREMMGGSCPVCGGELKITPHET